MFSLLRDLVFSRASLFKVVRSAVRKMLFSFRLGISGAARHFLALLFVFHSVRYVPAFACGLTSGF
jgi:hypothetical protein